MKDEYFWIDNNGKVTSVPGANQITALDVLRQKGLYNESGILVIRTGKSIAVVKGPVSRTPEQSEGLVKLQGSRFRR